MLWGREAGKEKGKCGKSGGRALEEMGYDALACSSEK